jgi:intracellular multiplication protein IcmK
MAPSPDGGQVAPQQQKTEIDLVGEVKASEPTSMDIKDIKEIWESMRRAQEKPAGDQPRPVISMTNVNLSPGSTPPLVRISNTTGAILMFMDANGRKWPVDHVDNLSDNQIDTSDKPIDPAKEQNSIFVKAKKFGAAGNIAVFLRNMDTPVIITFLAGQKDVDYRVDFRIPASVDGSVSNGVASQYFDNRLSSAIMRITPSGCEPEKSDSVDLMAWRCDKELIIRSAGVLLSPATIDGKKASGADGTNSYIIPITPIVSMLIGGKARAIKLGDL